MTPASCPVLAPLAQHFSLLQSTVFFEAVNLLPGDEPTDPAEDERRVEAWQETFQLSREWLRVVDEQFGYVCHLRLHQILAGDVASEGPVVGWDPVQVCSFSCAAFLVTTMLRLGSWRCLAKLFQSTDSVTRPPQRAMLDAYRRCKPVMKRVYLDSLRRNGYLGDPAAPLRSVLNLDLSERWWLTDAQLADVPPFSINLVPSSQNGTSSKRLEYNEKDGGARARRLARVRRGVKEPPPTGASARQTQNNREVLVEDDKRKRKETLRQEEAELCEAPWGLPEIKAKGLLGHDVDAIEADGITDGAVEARKVDQAGDPDLAERAVLRSGGEHGAAAAGGDVLGSREHLEGLEEEVALSIGRNDDFFAIEELERADRRRRQPAFRRRRNRSEAVGRFTDDASVRRIHQRRVPTQKALVHERPRAHVRLIITNDLNRKRRRTRGWRVRGRRGWRVGRHVVVGAYVGAYVGPSPTRTGAAVCPAGTGAAVAGAAPGTGAAVGSGVAPGTGATGAGVGSATGAGLGSGAAASSRTQSSGMKTLPKPGAHAP
eukprot:CAMPEP_0198653276 /NCGR_PEP_ID=MMETSP1467-20131203/6939_1 /TAXON_ID=1462469 /ORGANISM="unid. sp., Strain CCMP2135" /LENGTH=544 /DNA_ID=CAMNT_0044389235 /DNA_START=54 /DNA_END=1691 /DNA_ORIENTATION=+